MSVVSATVCVHTNDKHYLGALVAQHSMRRNSRHADRFDVQILHTRDRDFLRRRHGQQYLRGAAPSSGASTICSRSRRCASCRPS
jgi:hypothetical protein